jgi:hypothetical protein
MASDGEDLDSSGAVEQGERKIPLLQRPQVHPLSWKRLYNPRLMSRGAWIMVSVLLCLILIFTSFSVILPFWSIEYFDGCDREFIIIYMLAGACQTSDPTIFIADNCTSWSDHSDWERIDQESDGHAHTAEEAKTALPASYGLLIGASVVTAVQLLVAGCQLNFFSKSPWCQRTMMAASVLYVALIIIALSVSQATTVFDSETWQFTNTCSQSTSSPQTGVVLLFPFTIVFTSTVFMLSLFPEKVWCVHMVRPDDARFDPVPAPQQPPSLGSAGFPPKPSDQWSMSIEYPDPTASSSYDESSHT